MLISEQKLRALEVVREAAETMCSEYMSCGTIGEDQVVVPSDHYKALDDALDELDKIEAAEFYEHPAKGDN